MRIDLGDCDRCDGCGRLADTKDREPWTAWTSMPLSSSIAVVAGVVKPMTCPECCGTGRLNAYEHAARLVENEIAHIRSVQNALVQLGRARPDQEWPATEAVIDALTKAATEIRGAKP